VTDPGPGFVAVSVSVELLPAATVPKFSVCGRLSVPYCGCWMLGPALTPWQPTRNSKAAKSNTAIAHDLSFHPTSFFIVCIVNFETASLDTDGGAQWRRSVTPVLQSAASPR